MKNKILVTGATGFLGRHLVAALRFHGHIVETHSSSDGDIARCQLPIDSVGRVFHLAAKNFVPDSWENPLSFYATNVMGTINVLEHCRRQRAALTLVSSYVYGTPRELPISEGHPIAALNPYSHTKIMAEETARFYAEHFEVPLVIVRPFNLYGPGQQSAFLIPSIVNQVLDPSAAIVKVKDLRPKRDYLYVEDAVELLLATLQAEVRGVYNMGSGNSVSVAEVAELAKQAAGVHKPVMSTDEPRPGEVLDVVADCSRAATELGWQPRTSLADGLAAVVAAERKSRA